MSEFLPADVEGALRTYLRNDAQVAALFGSRIFFGVDDPSAFPVCVLTRVGGGLGGGTAEGMTDVALIQLDVWGDKHDKQSAFNGMAEVLGALNRMSRYTDVPNVVLHGANVQSWAFLTDPGERARYTITAQIIASPTA